MEIIIYVHEFGAQNPVSNMGHITDWNQHMI